MAKSTEADRRNNFRMVAPLFGGPLLGVVVLVGALVLGNGANESVATETRDLSIYNKNGTPVALTPVGLNTPPVDTKFLPPPPMSKLVRVTDEPGVPIIMEEGHQYNVNGVEVGIQKCVPAGKVEVVNNDELAGKYIKGTDMNRVKVVETVGDPTTYMQLVFRKAKNGDVLTEWTLTLKDLCEPEPDMDLRNTQRRMK